MRTIRRTSRFKKDYKREIKGKHRDTLADALRDVLALLIVDAPLPENYRDHALAGVWHDHRDCHIKPDLILIYRKPNLGSLELVRLGSHSELGF